MRVGEKFKDGRYTVLHKLGWGHFSTVWMVRDEQVRQECCAIGVVVQHLESGAVMEAPCSCLGQHVVRDADEVPWVC